MPQHMPPRSPVVCALRILNGWLRASNIPTRPPGEKDRDLDVVRRDGSVLAVNLTEGPGEVRESRILVSQKDLLSSDRAAVLGAFHSVTEQAQYGRPEPLQRQAAPAKKLNFNEEFDLVAIRHNKFRRAVNPPTSDLLRYDRVVGIACRNFERRNRTMCRSYGMEIDDLRTYAWSWVVNFMADTELPPGVGDLDENQKLLMSHLKQRFLDLLDLLRKKQRNVMAKPVDYIISVHGTTFDENHRIQRHSIDPRGDGAPVEDEVPEITAEYRSRHNHLDLKNKDTRRQSAAALLTNMLGALPHDVLVSTLAEESLPASHRHPDAVSEAARRLRDHVNGCASCEALRQAQADEQHPAVNTPRATE